MGYVALRRNVLPDTTGQLYIVKVVASSWVGEEIIFIPRYKVSQK